MPRKVHSDQFKRDAVAMYENNPDVSLKVVSEDLGINRSTLRVWVDKYEGVRKFVCEALIQEQRAHMTTCSSRLESKHYPDYPEKN